MSKSAVSEFDALWDYSEPAQTEKEFLNLLSTYETIPALKAELLTQIARTFSLRQMFDEAQQYLDQANALITGDMPKARVRYWLERGRSFNSAGQKEKAIGLFEKAWSLAKECKEDFHAVDAAHMLAIASPQNEQMTWHKTAIAHAEQSDDERARNWLGSLYNNLGWTLYDEAKFTGLRHWRPSCWRNQSRNAQGS